LAILDFLFSLGAWHLVLQYFLEDVDLLRVLMELLSN